MNAVLLEFGPVYAFWLFSYACYNGILGNQPNNNRAMETQLMNRFVKDNYAYSFDFREHFSGTCNYEDLLVGY